MEQTIAIEHSGSGVGDFRLNKYAAILLPAAFLATFTAACITKDFSTLVAFLLLLLAGLLFRNVARHVYWSVFAIYCIFSFLLAIGFYIDHGDPFIGGGDDELFYEFSIRAYKYGLDDFEAMLDAMNYKGVLVFFSAVIGFLDFFAVNDVSHFSLLFFNCALSAAAITFFYLASLRIAYFQTVQLGFHHFLLAALFPITLFYSSVFLRDCWVTFLFSIVLFINVRARNLIIRLVLSLLVIGVAYGIRPASAAFIAAFFLVFNFYKSSSAIKILWLAVMAAVAVFAAGNVEVILKTGSIDQVMEGYVDLAADESSSNSIGLRLIQSQNPVVKFISFVYLILSPIPPPALFKFTFHYLVISIGSLLWYFILPVVVYAHIKNFFADKSRLLRSFFITVALAVVVVSFSTNNVRHLQFIYPLFLLLFLGLVRSRPVMIKELFKIYMIFFFLLALFYPVLKFVLL